MKVLDAFREILVLGGFSVDTVESGREVLALVRERDYDFVFTDLKMPEMDGVDVVKAVHHLRPDVDLAVITGYATVETAVETMTDVGLTEGGAMQSATLIDGTVLVEGGVAAEEGIVAASSAAISSAALVEPSSFSWPST